LKVGLTVLLSILFPALFLILFSFCLKSGDSFDPFEAESLDVRSFFFHLIEYMSGVFVRSFAIGGNSSCPFHEESNVEFSNPTSYNLAGFLV
jgi:hypothetical protein